MLNDALGYIATLISKTEPGMAQVYVDGSKVCGLDFFSQPEKLYVKVRPTNQQATGTPKALTGGLLSLVKVVKKSDESFALSATPKRIRVASATGRYDFPMKAAPAGISQAMAVISSELPLIEVIDFDTDLPKALKLLAPIYDDDSFLSSVCILPGVDRLASWSSACVTYLKGGFNSTKPFGFSKSMIRATQKLGQPDKMTVIDLDGNDAQLLSFSSDGWTTEVIASVEKNQQATAVSQLLDGVPKVGKIAVNSGELSGALVRSKCTESPVELAIDPDRQLIEIRSQSEFVDFEETVAANVDVTMNVTNLKINPSYLVDVLRASTLGLDDCSIDLFLDAQEGASRLVTQRGFLMVMK